MLGMMINSTSNGNTSSTIKNNSTGFILVLNTLSS